MNKEEYKKFLNELEKIENNEKCPICKEQQIISVHYNSYLFQCSNCGEYLTYDIENKKWKN